MAMTSRRQGPQQKPARREMLMTLQGIKSFVWVGPATVVALLINSPSAYSNWRERSGAEASMSDRAVIVLAQAAPSATVTYDGAGRTATVLYTDQTCVAHKYNAQGDRKETAVTKADTPETSIWASGVWGCSKWDHP